MNVLNKIKSKKQNSSQLETQRIPQQINPDSDADNKERNIFTKSSKNRNLDSVQTKKPFEEER